MHQSNSHTGAMFSPAADGDAVEAEVGDVPEWSGAVLSVAGQTDL